MPELHVLRVFTAADGRHGNPLGVFLAGAEVAAGSRGRVAADLGFPETVFVDDRERGAVQYFTPASEIRFAGHPSVGTAWLLAREGSPAATLRLAVGEVGVRRDGELTWISAEAEWAPAIDFVELGLPREVEELDGPPPGTGFAYCWAWADRQRAELRARSFPGDFGIAEDEATGAAAIALCARLRRPLTIHQGSGSLLHAAPLEGGRVEVGGRVALDEVRSYPL